MISETGIPIITMGRDRGMAEKVAGFLQPTYIVKYHAVSADDLKSALSDQDVRGIMVGISIPEEEQDEIETYVKQVNSEFSKAIKVVRSKPEQQHHRDLYANCSDIPMPERVLHIHRAVLDHANLCAARTHT